jgi:N-acetylmuramoyl-L-alanine amidase
MKKFLLVILILLLGFGGYLLYINKFKEKIPKLEIQEETINIDELYIYGTHLNLHGNTVQGDGLQLVLYNGEFKEISININDDEFNLSDKVNDGLYLEDIARGDYYLFLRTKETSDDDKVNYKYYALKNNTDYKETTYYTFSNTNNKIIINSEESYPTMMMHVKENTDDNVYDIVIDPGHGGMDSGANKNGYYESELTMELADLLYEKLKDTGLKVKLTRQDGELTKNEKLPEYGVHGRAVIPYEVKAKYVFSIHFNSNYYSSINGLEVYTADNINYDLAKNLVKNITETTGIGYSSNKISKVMNGIYTRTFTESEIESSSKENEEKGRVPYDITTKSNYYYIIRETGGIVTGAYVDNRNEEIKANPYVKSNVGSETYLLELGYISNNTDLDNLLNNMDKYAEGIVKSITPLYK